MLILPSIFFLTYNEYFCKYCHFFFFFFFFFFLWGGGGGGGGGVGWGVGGGGGGGRQINIYFICCDFLLST